MNSLLLLTFILGNASARRRSDEIQFTAKLEVAGVWAEWSDWSDCSVTCGRGTRSRYRDCVAAAADELDDNVASEPADEPAEGYQCGGRDSDFVVCNEQVCASDIEPRESQCAEYNIYFIEAGFYQWVNHGTGENPCDLICSAVGYTLQQNFGQVTDGTSCGQDGGEDLVCVEGKCSAVGCDGHVGSELVLDNCNICNGRNVDCIHLVGTYTKRVANSSSYLHVLKVPSQATYVELREHSTNYIAVADTTMSYVVNGQWTFDRPGEYQLGDVTIVYERDANTEVISVTQTPIDLNILLMPIGSRPLLQFEFFLPKSQMTALWLADGVEVSTGAAGDVIDHPPLDDDIWPTYASDVTGDVDLSTDATAGSGAGRRTDIRSGTTNVDDWRAVGTYIPDSSTFDDYRRRLLTTSSHLIIRIAPTDVPVVASSGRSSGSTVDAETEEPTKVDSLRWTPTVTDRAEQIGRWSTSTRRTTGRRVEDADDRERRNGRSGRPTKYSDDRRWKKSSSGREGGGRTDENDDRRRKDNRRPSSTRRPDDSDDIAVRRTSRGRHAESGDIRRRADVRTSSPSRTEDEDDRKGVRRSSGGHKTEYSRDDVRRASSTWTPIGRTQVGRTPRRQTGVGGDLRGRNDKDDNDGRRQHNRDERGEQRRRQRRPTSEDRNRGRTTMTSYSDVQVQVPTCGRRCSKAKPGVKRQYCESDFVAVVTVFDFQYVDNATRYDMQIDSVVRQKTSLLSDADREFVHVTNTCRCPRLLIGEQYVVMGHVTQVDSEIRLELDERSFTQLASKWDKRFRKRQFACD